jgi:hypothetical protein
MRKIALLTILLILMPLVGASIKCPCGNAGEEGSIVGFMSRDGIPQNTTLYINKDQPELNDTVIVWAYVTRTGTDGNEVEVPAENVTVNVKRDDQSIAVLKSDDEGYVDFLADKPGDYLVIGGDDTLEFTIDAPPEPPKNDTTNDTNATRPNDTIEEQGNVTEGVVSTNRSTGKTTNNPEEDSEQEMDWSLIIIIVAIIAIAAVIYIYR